MRSGRSTTFNEAPPANGTALYTQAWGPMTPTLPGATALILFPLPGARSERRPRRPGRRGPNRRWAGADPARRRRPRRRRFRCGRARVRGAGRSGDHLPPDLQAGLARRRLARSAAGRRSCATAPRSSAQARRSRRFSSAPRAPRTGLGQLADGRIILVAVDGRQPGYSVGLTNFELAQTMVRLGAVTAMALDGGGSTTMAFNGTLLNRPSGPERPISTALLFQYTGVFVQPRRRGRLARRRRHRRPAEPSLQARSPCRRRP